MSITFRDVPDVDVTAANYELGIPWCFPVEVDKDSNGNYQRIYRPKDRIGGELPDYKLYRKNGKGEYGKKTGSE